MYTLCSIGVQLEKYASKMQIDMFREQIAKAKTQRKKGELGASFALSVHDDVKATYGARKDEERLVPKTLIAEIDAEIEKIVGGKIWAY